MKKADFVGIGFVSNDHLAILPFIPMDTKVKMLEHRILGGGPVVSEADLKTGLAHIKSVWNV